MLFPYKSYIFLGVNLVFEYVLQISLKIRSARSFLLFFTQQDMSRASVYIPPFVSLPQQQLQIYVSLPDVCVRYSAKRERSGQDGIESAYNHLIHIGYVFPLSNYFRSTMHCTSALVQFFPRPCVLFCRKILQQAFSTIIALR